MHNSSNHIHPRIFIENSHLPLVNCPRILGVYLDPSLSFNKHNQYVAERVSGRNNILKALAGTSWGQQKETLLMTYKAVGRSIINYAVPVWSPNLHDTNYRKIKYTQNEALRIATGCHKMSSIDHLHTEAEMLKVREHSELLSAQYLAICLEPGNVCHPITKRAIPERQMKETLMCLFVLCVACLTVFVNCLVKQFAMCVGVVAILLLNVMDVFSVCGGALLDRPCMVFQRVCVLCL